MVWKSTLLTMIFLCGECRGQYGIKQREKEKYNWKKRIIFIGKRYLLVYNCLEMNAE